MQGTCYLIKITITNRANQERVRISSHCEIVIRLPNLVQKTIIISIFNNYGTKYFYYSFQIKISQIEVAEYVLPRFEAIIESPDDFTLDDGAVRAVIRAKYTHGKPLRGSVTVSITDKNNFSTHLFGFARDNKPNDNTLVKKTFNIDGKETVEFDIEKELKFERNNSMYWQTFKNYKIKADVTEGLTGLVQSADKTVKVYWNSNNKHRHPHFPKPDNPSMSNNKISLTAKVLTERQATDKFLLNFFFLLHSLS